MKRAPLVLLGMFLAVVLIVPAASAETWVLLWNEDFTDASDWSLEGHWTTGAGKLQFILGDGAASYDIWRGPTFRSAGGSTWNDATSPILNISINDLRFIDYGQGAKNTQFSMVLIDSATSHTPDVADAANYLEIRAQDATCCAAVGWYIENRDDGSTASQSFYGNSWRDKEIDANITINTLAKRLWINWTAGAESGAHTYSWAGDGAFAETDTVRLNLWGYASWDAATFPIFEINNLALYTAQLDSPPPPPPPPPPRGEVHGDFLWEYTAFGVQFFDYSNAPGRIVTWTWVFGDGYGSKRQDPMHDFPCAGDYSVVLYLEDVYGNKGNVSKHVIIDEDSPTCGILQRSEEGLAIHTDNGWITIPQAFFLGLLVFSGGTLFLGIDLKIISVPVRWLLFFLSLAMLMISYGVLAWFF